MERSERGGDECNDIPPILFDGDVETVIFGDSARLANGSNNVVALGLQNIPDHDPCAGLREQPSLGCALTSTAAGDENRLVREVSFHDRCPFVTDFGGV